MRPTILANPPTQYEVITAATIAPVPDGPWLRFPNQNSNASYAFGKAGQEFDISMTIKFLGANGNQRLFGVYNRSVQYGVRVQMTATQIVISDAGQAINIAVIAYVMPANGRAVPFRLICKNNTYVIYIDGTRYGPYPFMLESGYASWGGQTPESWLILPVSVDNIGDLYFKDVSIKPVPKAEDFSKVEVIDVGNRRFMCELVKKVKWSELTMAGDTNPTNIGTADDPIINMYDVTAGANSKSYFYMNQVLTAMKLSDNMVVTIDAAIMDDDSSLNVIGQLWYPWMDPGYGTVCSEYVRHDTGNGLIGSTSSYLSTSSTGSIVYGSAMPNNNKYSTIKFFKHIDDYGFELWSKFFSGKSTILENTESGYPPTWYPTMHFEARHDAGQVSHMRAKNIKIYKIIAEARP